MDKFKSKPKNNPQTDRYVCANLNLPKCKQTHTHTPEHTCHQILALMSKVVTRFVCSS